MNQINILKISDLAEGFSRFCALYDGTYIFNSDIEEILLDENDNSNPQIPIILNIQNII